MAMAARFDRASPKVQTWCDHLAFLSSDLAGFPHPETPCMRCQDPNDNWFCLYCKDVLCSRKVNKHFFHHYQQANHCLAASCRDQRIWCFSCDTFLDARVIPQLRSFLSSAKVQTRCDHLALLSSDLTGIPNSNTPCERCQEPNENWFCLSCKVVRCSRYVNEHMLLHYEQTNHCLAVSCRNQAIWCYSCHAYLDARLIPQLFSKGLSFASKLQKLDALMVDAINLISEPVPSFDSHPPGSQSLVGNNVELALAKEGLQKILDHELEALADPQVQNEFLAYSAVVLKCNLCPKTLRSNLSHFRVNISSEGISTFLQAQYELKVVSNLSASITNKRFVLQQQTSKYAKAKKEILALDKKSSNIKAEIKKLESQIKNLEACLTRVESDMAKTNEVFDSIETQVTTVRDGLVSDLAQVPDMDEKTEASNILVTHWLSEWDNLRASFKDLAGGIS